MKRRLHVCMSGARETVCELGVNAGGVDRPGYFTLGIIYIHGLYTPRTQDWGLPSRDGKGSKAALKGAAREHGGSTMGQYRGAAKWETWK